MTVRVGNWHFGIITSKNRLREALFKKFCLLCRQKTYDASLKRFWGAYCFSKVRFATCTDLYIYIYFIIYLLLLGTYSTKQVMQSKNPCVVNFTIGFVDTLKSMT